jgi:hydroxyacylglutathione hydrolase
MSIAPTLPPRGVRRKPARVFPSAAPCYRCGLPNLPETVMAYDLEVFRCLSDNAGVLVHDPATGACAAIDVPDADAVSAALARRGWTLTDILVTHAHADHVQGIAALKAKTGARVVAPAKSGTAVREADLHVGEGDTVAVGSLGVTVWETPGHCQDHVTYWFEEENLLFPGDVLFVMGCGRVVSGSAPQLWTSLSRCAELADQTVFVCGHDYTWSNARFALAADPGNADLRARAAEAERAAAEGRFLATSTIGQEKATNPFLRAGLADLARSVKKEGASAGDVFAALREWKNGFKG